MILLFQNKLTSGHVKAGKEGKEVTEQQKGASSAKAEEISQLLEFVWDLCKQAMGIAVLSENEAKKQARKVTTCLYWLYVYLIKSIL